MYQIDPKYGIKIREDGRAVVAKNLTGEEIPAGEPMILFRARDRHALKMLLYYFDLCAADDCTIEHLNGIQNRLQAFADFAEGNPGRMKQPGITRGL